MKRKIIYGLIAGFGLLGLIGVGNWCYKLSKGDITKTDQIGMYIGFGLMAISFMGTTYEFFNEEYKKDKQNKLEKNLTN